MSVTVLVTHARCSLPAGIPWVALTRFLVRSFHFSSDVDMNSPSGAACWPPSGILYSRMTHGRGCHSGAVRIVRGGRLTPGRFGEAIPRGRPSHLFRRDRARAVEDVAVLVLDVRGENVLAARQRLEEQEQVVGDGGLERSGHAAVEARGEALIAYEEEDLRGSEAIAERIVNGQAVEAHVEHRDAVV